MCYYATSRMKRYVAILMSWKEWVLYLCHIETLFIIGVTILVIYLRFFKRDRKSTFVQLEELAGKIVDNSSSIQPDISIDETHSSLIKKPEKKVHKHEERCREIFKEIFGLEFKTVRPDWLKNPATGKRLELDGYNPNIMTPMGRGIAFEYDGIQHAK